MNTYVFRFFIPLLAIYDYIESSEIVVDDM